MASEDSEPSETQGTFRRTLVSVLTMQVAALLVLALLQWRYSR